MDDGRSSGLGLDAKRVGKERLGVGVVIGAGRGAGRGAHGDRKRAEMWAAEEVDRGTVDTM